MIALLMATAILSFPMSKIECSQPVVQEQMKFWDNMVEKVGKHDIIDEIKLGCFVIDPPIQQDEFKSSSFSTSLLDGFNEVVMPWSVFNNSLNIIKGKRVSLENIEFMEIFYLYKTGNLIIIKVYMTRPMPFYNKSN